MIQRTGTREAGREMRVARHVLRAAPLWTLLLIALLTSAALWGPGMVNTHGGGDSPFLLQRAHQMAVNLRAGIFPVRWMPDAAYGLGYPFFNHYAALPFYLAAIFQLIGVDLLTALKVTQTLGFVIAGLAMFGWIHCLWGNRRAAWLAAIAYTVAPFHLVNVYVRGDSLSEFFAFVWYPMILWSTARVVTRTSFLNAIPLALSYAGLILTHNISALIFSPFVLLYLILAVWPDPEKKHKLAAGLGGMLGGLALSAWFWVPALLETRYGQPGTLTLGYFHYANHFRTANLVQPGLLFDYSVEVTVGGSSPFSMGGPQALAAALGLFLLLYLVLHGGRRTQDARATTNHKPAFLPRHSSFPFLIIGLLLSTIMITPLSRPLWDHLPLLELVQFPWRFLSVQALFAAAAPAVLVLRLRGGRAWAVAGAVAASLIVSALLPLRPERLPIGPDDVTTTRLQEYEWFSANIGTTIRYEYLPRETVPRFFTSDAVIDPQGPPQPIALAGVLEDARQIQRGPIERVWRVRTADSGATAAFPLLYWPGWRGWVDGESVPVQAVEGSGYLALDVPAGEHTVRLKLGRTPLRAGAEALSLIALVALLAVVLWRARAESRMAHCVSRALFYARRNVQHGLLVLIGLLFLISRSSSPPDRPGDLTMDFAAMQYLHHNPDGIVFAGPEGDASHDPLRLLNYTFSADQLAPGDTLTVTLRWDGERQAGEGGEVTLRLVSPAEHLPNGISSYTLAEDPAPLAATTVHRLTLPENTPRGLYLPQLGLRGSGGELFARTPSGETRGPLFLRPVRVTQGAPVPADAPLLALVGPDIRLHAAGLAPGPGSDHLTVRLEWSTVRRLARNYGISVRLLDPNGDLTATDTQPGYGFAPTSLWRPGERVADRYTLRLPAELPSGDGYRLAIVFYQFPSLTEVARVGLGPFTLPLEVPHIFEPGPRLFELPKLPHSLDVDFVDSVGGDRIRLAGYDVATHATSLDLTLWWVAQRQPRVDYTVFVHLFDPQTEVIPVQHDAMPRQGSYPTSGWLAGEVVSETIRLSLDGAPPGAYRLAVGFYQVATRDRLSAVAADGASLPDGRLILPDVLEVPDG